MTNEITKFSAKSNEISAISTATSILKSIRPEWQAKGLIQRTTQLLPIDSSSACQRLLNAALRDLRNKIAIAGIDLAKEAASRFGLPPVGKIEDISENYTNAKILDLSYRMGILSRPEWQKMKRCYDIRGDLEHEDDEYEADAADVIYIFKNCIELVLARDPVEILRIDDIKQLISSPSAPTVTDDLIEEFNRAPNSRQLQIIHHLTEQALNEKQSDVVRQNSLELLRQFRGKIKNTVYVDLAAALQDRYRQRRYDITLLKVTHASGVLPYLKQSKVRDAFTEVLENFEKVGAHWKSYDKHVALFDELEDIGNLQNCPEILLENFVEWMVNCYLGERSYGQGANFRNMFYSNTAWSRIQAVFKESGSSISPILEKMRKDKDFLKRIEYKPMARRFEQLCDIADGIEG